MKKFLDRLENVVEEMQQGLAVLSPGIVRLSGHKVMYRADAVQVRDRQVAIISGGGSGHEPAHAGYEALQVEYQKGIAYGFQMGLRPQTLYGIADSPVGLAAYFLDHDARSYELISRVFAGGSRRPHARRHSRQHHDHLVDEHSAFRGPPLLGEQGKSFFSVKGVVVPIAVSVFPDELYPAPRSWAERAYPKLIHFNKLPKGGHFAAWEQPKLFSEEVRAGFRSLR